MGIHQGFAEASPLLLHIQGHIFGVEMGKPTLILVRKM